MIQKHIHGVVRPHGRVPGNVVNISSKKATTNNTIKLDRLLNSDKPRILIKRHLGGIGDVIMSTPLLKKIKKLIPHCELTYMTDLVYSNGALATIIRHNPYVDILLGNGQAKESDYDYCVDITTTGLSREKSGMIPPNRIDMFAEEVGVSVADDPVPDYIVFIEEKEKAKQFIKKIIPNRDKVKLIGIQCRSNDARRTWPLEYVEKLADLLAKNDNYFIFLFDWGHDSNIWKKKDRVKPIVNLPFEDTAALVEQCDLIVCPDSSMLHIAGALNKRIVTVFGPIPAESRINHYANAVAVQLKLPCSGCWYSAKCRNNNSAKLECLTGISPEMVEQTVYKKIAEPEMIFSTISNQKPVVNSTDSIIFIKRSYGGMGDILMFTPGLKVLKERYPDKQIHLAIPKQYIPVMENLPFIDQLIDINLPYNPKKYFLTADLSNPCARYENARLSTSKKVEKSRVEIFAEALGVRDRLANHVPIYNVSEDEKKWAEGFFSSQKLNKEKKLVAVNLSSAEVYRDYPKNKQNKLIEELLEKYNVIELGMNRTGENKRTIDACGFPIRKWAAILSLCDGFVTVDTGPLHVSAALDIPTIALFGPIDYKMRCKGYKNVTVLLANLDCIPCWRNSVTKCIKTNTIAGYSKCIEEIPIKSILETLKTKIIK